MKNQIAAIFNSPRKSLAEYQADHSRLADIAAATKKLADVNAAFAAYDAYARASREAAASGNR